ncbi:MAG: hypothetical protein HY360_07190 [Verrucomicrobia bacterium]|nr:hypothetical protein [Verrucomicrobiota bacterium]
MASRDKIFLDTDVALDHLADRQPFAEYAHRIFALAETGELTKTRHPQAMMRIAGGDELYLAAGIESA